MQQITKVPAFLKIKKILLRIKSITPKKMTKSEEEKITPAQKSKIEGRISGLNLKNETNESVRPLRELIPPTRYNPSTGRSYVQ